MTTRQILIVTLALQVINFVIAIVGNVTAMHPQHYGDAATLNEGYVINLPAPWHCAGYETRGNRGWFVNVDC